MSGGGTCKWSHEHGMTFFCNKSVESSFEVFDCCKDEFLETFRAQHQEITLKNGFMQNGMMNII